MRKFYAILAVLTLILSIGVTAMAQGKGARKAAKKTGCADCVKCDVTPEQMRKFKLDTIDLRQELMNKRFDLQRENLKETPDSAKVAALEAEIAAVKDKIDTQRKSAKLPESICNDRDCPLMAGDCGKCVSGKGCACSCCEKAGSCEKCKDCKDCTCKNCAKKADCSKCNTKKQPVRAGCNKCNKK
ncbi:MAG TPA: hypothetical protein VFF53_11110 [Geobacteraceae bacterium]|nr:hypothetical protein [Geobacteraceae bacterium]